MRARIVLTLVVVLAVAAGCGGSGDASSRKTVVAAFYPIAYAAQRVDPGAEVENLTPAGAEPHDLELSARDVERVQSADTVLYLGEGFMPALEQAVEGRDNAVDLLAGQRLVKGPEAGEAVLDPHVWLAPLRYAAIVRTVADALEALVDEVKRDGATTIFFETLVSPKLARTVARETGADTAVLDPIEGLTKDEAERGEDYFSVMRSNLAALRKALGCT
jgi:ABC-type Zn uptake system ZnuABC Zn-binding protein ZnuA